MKIRILSYNIHKGFHSFGVKFVLHEIRQALRETKADILLLQEVVGENKNHQKNLKDWPSEAQFEFLADSVWSHYSYGKNAIFDERNHGNAILSKFPILQAENIDISNNKWEQRGLLHCELQVPEIRGKSLHLFNVHLDLWESGRHKQLHRIIQRAQSHVPNGAPFILGGDFNDWSQSLSPLFYEFLGVHESFDQNQGSHAQTFPSFFPVLRLDRLYYKHLTVSFTTTLTEEPWSNLSDHLPILAEFEIE
ncbi:MAG: endonuclease/exonuclease/phosphatase [Oligoflexia bacterium]|nr:MAG: endonuclease/exonuclease/phosphatase [Oligoflexia bacterium]